MEVGMPGIVIIAEISDKVPSVGSAVMAGIAVACVFVLLLNLRRSLARLALLPLLLVNFIYLAPLTDTVDGQSLGAIAGGSYLRMLVTAINGPLLLAVLASSLMALWRKWQCRT